MNDIIEQINIKQKNSLEIKEKRKIYRQKKTKAYGKKLDNIRRLYKNLISLYTIIISQVILYIKSTESIKSKNHKNKLNS